MDEMASKSPDRLRIPEKCYPGTGESMSWGSMQVWGFGPMERLRESNEEINFFSPLLQKNNLRWNAMTFHLH